MTNKTISLAIVVSALGYFIDVYDIILFSVVRVSSLSSLGLTEEAITEVGLRLLNIQLLGMLLGGIAWGILGDKKGRLFALFGSILLYSSATFANAFVHSIEAYTILRFIAGFGLAGELGGGITLVSELISKEKRGLGTMVVVGAGVLGGITGGLIGNIFAWQTAYVLGGIGGFSLLFLRMRVSDSCLFHEIQHDARVKKGNLCMLLKSATLRSKFLKCLCVGMPFWVFVGLFMALAPEVGSALHVQGKITAGWALLCFNVGLALGDFSSSLLSQIFQSRKSIVQLYLLLTFFVTVEFLLAEKVSTTSFYAFCTALGFASGFWALFIILVAEQFGTNLRATVSAAIPNLVRGLVIPFSFILMFIKPFVGILWGLGGIALTCILLALIAIHCLEETFSADLCFIESG